MASAAPLDGVSLPTALEQAKVPSLPATAYYIPDFISEQEEQIILDKIASAPKPRWKQLSHRRLQTWPSDLVRDRLLDEPLPPWLNDPVVTRLLSIPLRTLDSSHLFASSPHQRPNHVLINEYPPGIGIMPHKDGSAYYPVVCTVSLGASLCLNIYKSKEDGALDPEPAYRILQEPRSLLITTNNLYTDFLHGISDIAQDRDLSADSISNWDLLRSPDHFVDGLNHRSTRTSLTYRDVLKVSKLGNNLGKFLKR
ncbi:Alkbh6 protein [Coniella lustricola]|uniref:Alkbh6 protein n=1 Tax=Coniella lustricola TaxID=2025994 RepID=A0A2T3AE83_9PEZI|nr:Alkbh6 protein [Coniella lustricola]